MCLWYTLRPAASRTTNRFSSLTPDGMLPRPCKTVALRQARWECAYSPGLACYAPFDNHYELAADRLIRAWQAEDRTQTGLEWKAELRAMHHLGETSTPLRGRFSNIARDIFAGKQPLYYLESLGMNGLTCKPFARVKLASSYLRLYVNLGDSLRPVSKNKKRKAIRYGRPLPDSVGETIAKQVSLAVKDYLSH